MSGAILMLSITFVIQDQVYKHVEFYTGIVLFIAGKFIGAVILWMGSGCKHIVSDARKYGKYFLFLQITSLFAVVFTLRAIEIAPSISLVAAVESSTPLFIMLFSILLIPFVSRSSTHGAAIVCVLKEQLVKVPVKVVAAFFLISGIFVVTEPEMSDFKTTHNQITMAQSTPILPTQSLSNVGAVELLYKNY